MKANDQAEFGLLLAAMAAAYREETDEALLEGYWITLNDLPLADVKAAIGQAMRTLKFMPKAAEIREIVVTNAQREAKASLEAREARQKSCEQLATKVVVDGRRQGWDDDTIKRELRNLGRCEDVELFWPGDEPWNKQLI